MDTSNSNAQFPWGGNSKPREGIEKDRDKSLSCEKGHNCIPSLQQSPLIPMPCVILGEGLECRSQGLMPGGIWYTCLYHIYVSCHMVG